MTRGCRRRGGGRQRDVDRDIHRFVPSSVNDCRAHHYENQANRCQRDEDWCDVCDGRQDQPSRAEYLDESDQSDLVRAEILRPATWPDLTSLSLGTDSFISPLPAKLAAKTIATIHSAKFMTSSFSQGYWVTYPFRR
jgi:hypothetical protein